MRAGRGQRGGGGQCEDTGGSGDGGTRPPTTSQCGGQEAGLAALSLAVRSGLLTRCVKQPEQALGAGVDAPLDR